MKKDKEDYKDFKDCDHDWEDIFIAAPKDLKHWIGRKCKKCKKIEYPLMYGH